MIWIRLKVVGYIKGGLMLEKLENEGAAIVGLVTIAIIAMFLLGINAKEIAIAIGSGLVGFIRGKTS